jgi:mycothione reductase
MSDHVDLAIIGSGSGNSLVTRDFDGKRVAIVESGTFGGTCLNVGCIPTKMFVYAADVSQTIRHAAEYGVDATLQGARWADIRDRIFHRIDPISAAGEDYRVHGPNTTAYLGRATFVGDRRLRVALHTGAEAEITAEQVVIAAGSTPMVPPVIAATGALGAAYHTSDTVMRIDSLPKRMAIIGGGYVACEFAHIFASLGVQVTLIVRGGSLLRHLDAEISHRFTAIATSDTCDWDVRLGRTVTAASYGSWGSRLVLDDHDVVTADVVLVATGRAPNTPDLDLGSAGVATHPDGRVAVDEHGRTSAPGVWALGDVSNPFQLKHVANHEARVVAHNLVHPEDLQSFHHEQVPAAVFTYPQIATVGATQEDLERDGVDYAVKVQSYGDTAYGWAMEDRTGVVKVLADRRTGLILGAHVLGAQASTVIQPVIQAMAFGQRADDIARRQYWIHPALSEVLENALLGLDLHPA